jgi:hypothetical protein
MLFAEALGAVEHEPEQLARAAALVARFAPLRDRLPAHELLQRLLEESGYAAAAALGEDGAQCTANLRKLVRLAGAAPELSLGEFLREVELAREREEKVPPERLYSEAGDVVTITSIHGAKGLEWPVVIWADLVRQRNAPKEALLMGRDGFAFKSADEADEESGGKDPVHEAVKAHEMLEGEAEMLRLWYVAATRAKELLILSGIPLGDLGKTDSPALRIRAMLPALGTGGEIPYESHGGVTYHAPVRTLDASPLPAHPRVEAEPAIALPPTPVAVPSGAARLSADQLMAFARDPAQWRRTYVTLRPALVGKSGRRAPRDVAGQVVHDVLEQVDANSISTVEQAIGRWDEDASSRRATRGAYRAFLRERVQVAAVAPPGGAGLDARRGARTRVHAPPCRRHRGERRVRPDRARRRCGADPRPQDERHRRDDARRTLPRAGGGLHRSGARDHRRECGFMLLPAGRKSARHACVRPRRAHRASSSPMHRPPATTAVRTTLTSLIVSGATSCGSFSSITKSASFPAVIVPLDRSSYDA